MDLEQLLALFPDNTVALIGADDIRVMVTEFYDRIVALEGGMTAVQTASSPEAIRAVVALALEAGANVSITVDDAGDRIVIAAADGPEVDLSSYVRYVRVTDASPDPERPGDAGGWVIFADERTGSVSRPTTAETQDLWIFDGTTSNEPVAPPVITTATLNSMTAGVPFSQTILATEPVSLWTAVGLPVGLSINGATGEITGTPASAGSYNITVTAQNAGGSDPQTYVGTVNAAPQAPIITTTALGSLSVGTPFSQIIGYTGDTATAAVVSAGVIPAGLAPSVAGGTVTISGTPTVDGPYSFTLQITSGSSGSDTQVYIGTVDDPPDPGGPLSVFDGEAFPYTQTIFNDGGGALKFATAFYAKDDPYTVTGAALHIPTGVTVPNSDLTLFVAEGLYDSFSTRPADLGLNTIMATLPEGQRATIPGASLHAGWNEVTFASPITVQPGPQQVSGAGNAHYVWIGGFFANGSTYVFTSSPTDAEIPSVAAVDMYIALNAFLGSASPARSQNWVFSEAWVGALYGLDIIAETA